MKVLIMDIEGEGTGVDLGVRAKEADHDVRYWLPLTRGGNRRPYGDGMLSKPLEWKSSMDWADLIIITGNNKYADELSEYFGKGYPIFGTNAKSAALELDRGHGQEILSAHGIDTIPYVAVKSIDEAMVHVVKTKVGCAIKPWGGDSNSAMTCVAKDANEAIFTLTKWKENGFKGELMIQELVEGVEMGVSGWFGPGGWSSAIEESFEHKKFLTGDLGENTGEMGTCIRHVTQSKLFDLVLEPLTDYLHLCRYVGDCSVNCIIRQDGSVAPLEFTMRLGWPDFTIRYEVIRGDPVEWMYDLLHGRDTLKVSTNVAVGVVMVHGDFPKCKDPPGTWAGYPIEGVTNENASHIHWQQVLYESTPRLIGNVVRSVRSTATAGAYVGVITGSAPTTANAVKRAYSTVHQLSWPSNVMYRTDIGRRLKKDLPLLHEHGFALGMEW